MNATILVVCYKSKTLSNGEHQLILRIAQDVKIIVLFISFAMPLSKRPDHSSFMYKALKKNIPLGCILK